MGFSCSLNIVTARIVDLFGFWRFFLYYISITMMDDWLICCLPFMFFGNTLLFSVITAYLPPFIRLGSLGTSGV